MLDEEENDARKDFLSRGANQPRQAQDEGTGSGDEGRKRNVEQSDEDQNGNEKGNTKQDRI